MEFFGHLFVEMIGSAAAAGANPGRRLVKAALAALAVMGCILVLAAMSAAGS